MLTTKLQWMNPDARIINCRVMQVNPSKLQAFLQKVPSQKINHNDHQLTIHIKDHTFAEYNNKTHELTLFNLKTHTIQETMNLLLALEIELVECMEINEEEDQYLFYEQCREAGIKVQGLNQECEKELEEQCSREQLIPGFSV